MKKPILLTLILIFLILPTFTKSTSSQENQPATLWIKIHRIQAIDQFDPDGADWHYRIAVWTNVWEQWSEVEYKCEPNHDDIIVDKTHEFDNITVPITTVIIDLLDDDEPYPNYDTADISSSIANATMGISGKRFFIGYDLTSNTFVETAHGLKDKVIFEEGYYKTSGEFDNQVAPSELDANLWFLIWDSQGPNAYFTYSPTNPTISETIQFTDTSPDPEGKITSRLWDFGDDHTSTDINPTHKYKKAGTYTVNLTVTDDEGAKGTMSQTILIKGAPFHIQPWTIAAFASILVAIIGITATIFIKRRKRILKTTHGSGRFKTHSFFAVARAQTFPYSPRTSQYNIHDPDTPPRKQI